MIRVPYRSYENISQISWSFLKSHGAEKEIPIDVEALLELRLGIGIIPIPGFQQTYSVEGSLSPDLKTIYVDEYVYRAVETRFRFTLAHELGHIILHRSILRELKFGNIAEWKKRYNEINDALYSALERQAYDFAGLVLVPSEILRGRFSKIVSESKSKFLQAKTEQIARDKALFYFKTQAVYKLSRMFNVSVEVMDRRVEKDNLTTLIP